MKIWLSKNSEVPVREQIVTQITLGIVSGDLPIGKRLPSTKEISNRFGVHSNTVSGAYQKLAEQGWLEFKKGSGFYVREVSRENVSDDLKLEKLIAEFFQNASIIGFSFEQAKERLQKHFHTRTSEKILIVESDRFLRDILTEEIRAVTNLKIEAVGYEEFEREHQNTNVIVAAMIDEKPKIEKLLLPDKVKVYLSARSIAGSMTGAKRPDESELIAVVSGWEKFLLWSKTILLAANIEPESLMVRSTDKPDWQNGLKSVSVIICDSLTAKKMPNDIRVRVFKVIADDSLEEITKLSKHSGVSI